MILARDRIEISANALPRLQALYRERYMPAVQPRGLALLDERVAPLLVLADRLNILWLRTAVLLASCYDPVRLAEDLAVAQIVSE